MGLDVYLYRVQGGEPTIAERARTEEESEHVWDKLYPELKYEQMTEAQREECRNAADNVYVKAGWTKRPLSPGSDYLTFQHPGITRIKHDSATDPEHYFKIGYLRSSYNEGGFNSVIRALLGKDLYWVFEVDEDYEFLPDWQATRERAATLVVELEAKLKDGNYRVHRVGFNQFLNPISDGREMIKDKETALRLFEKEKAASKGGSYSNRDGEFFFSSPLKVIGIVQGTENAFLHDGLMPVFYLIYEQEPEAEDVGKEDWYLRAARITLEMCDWVLAQENPQEFYLHWSG